MNAGKKPAAAVAAMDVGALALFDDLIRAALQAGASDVHLEPRPKGVFVRFRKGGTLVDGYDLLGASQALGVGEPPIVSLPRVVKRLLDPTETLSQIEIARPREGTISLPTERLDLRVSILPTALGESIVLRLHRTVGDGLALHALGLSDEMLGALESLLRTPRGLLLVCGPRGAGTTTTLHALTRHLDHPGKRILAIDEQGTTISPRVTQLRVSHDLSPIELLRAALRHDPDVVMAGDLREAEAARWGVRAAGNGQTVLAGVRAYGTADALVKLREMVGPHIDVGESCLGVLAQRLVRRTCAHCALPRPVSPRLRQLVERSGVLLPFEVMLHGEGCSRCDGGGWEGLTGVFELLVVTPDLRDALRQGASADDLERMSRSRGVRLLVEDALAKAACGCLSETEVLGVFASAGERKESQAPHETSRATLTEPVPLGAVQREVRTARPAPVAVLNDDELPPWAAGLSSDDEEVQHERPDDERPDDERPDDERPDVLLDAPCEAPLAKAVRSPSTPVFETPMAISPSAPLPPLSEVSPQLVPPPPEFGVEVAPRTRRVASPRDVADVSRRLRRL